MAVVGFDDFPMSDVLGLSVIRQDVAQLGAAVGERLLARLSGDQSPPRHDLLSPRLIMRGSGEIPPSEISPPEPSA